MSSESENAIRKQMAEQVQEAFASALNAVTWALLRKPDRTDADNEKMLYAAFASAYHHLEVGLPIDQQRASWLISRVYAVLGNGQEALRHARRCAELTEAHAGELEDYDRAFALEALARAFKAAGNTGEAAKYQSLATKAGEEIEDEASRKVFTDELAGL
jgi:hypothetical protein